jgi:hypothetical protein
VAEDNPSGITNAICNLPGKPAPILLCLEFAIGAETQLTPLQRNKVYYLAFTNNHLAAKLSKIV